MVTFTLNGKQTTFDGDPHTPLLWVIRDGAKLTGTKYGCGIAQCGAWVFIAGAGLIIGLSVMPRGYARISQGIDGGGNDPLPVMNTFVKVGTDNTVTILCKHMEMGQGPFTGLATLIAEEMGADWIQMRAVHAPVDDKVYANLLFGMQATGGSSTIANSYQQYREAGATARAMLVAAAAEEWGVPAAEITVARGRIHHAGTNKESGFGALADKAAQQAPPAEPVLKDPKDFVLTGKDTPKLDSLGKSTGKAIYTLDVLADNMLVAVVKHPDHFGATVKSFEDTEARKIKGVIDVKQVSSGIAVLAEDTFAALRGRAALKVQWELSKAETRSSPQLETDYAAKFSEKGIEAANRGDVDKAFGAAGVQSLETEVAFPFLAHAPLEPLDAVFVQDGDGGVDIYCGSQFPGADEKAASKILGINGSKVRVHTQLAGGSFGRRAQFGSPYMQEAAAARQ
jgi:isoquinoline 1-oxidoreductase beta subunit